MLTLGCTYQYVSQSVTINGGSEGRRAFAAEPLTVDLITEFGISSGELAGLRYYLGNTLVLYRTSVTTSGSVTAQGALELRRNRRQSEVEIRHMTPGSFVDLQEDFQIIPPRRYYRLLIHFQGSPAPLAFSPNFNGQYILEKSYWSNTVKYDEFGYSSLSPQTENYLLINTQLADNYTNSRNALPSSDVPPTTTPARPARRRGIY